MRTNKYQICGQEFDQLSLKIHIATFHKNKNNKEHTCNICEEVFEAKNQLEIHCGKLFSYEGNLKKHIHTIHVVIDDFNCECGKTFSNAGHLNKHIYAIHKSLKEHK